MSRGVGEIDERAASSQRRANAAAVLDRAWETSAFTASDVIAATGVTRSTAIALCDGFVERGWFAELPNARAVGEEYRKGRPARRYALRADAGAVVGVDAGRHTVTATVADLRGAELARVSTPLDAAGEEAGERVAAVDAAVDEAVRRSGAGTVLGIAVGVPAPTDGHGASPAGERFWGLMNPGYAAHFRERGWLTVVENDANLAALAEGAVGAGAGASSYVTLVSGERFGAGYVVDGHLVRGRRGGAGELGLLALVEGVGSAHGAGALLREWALEARESGALPDASPLMRTPPERLGAEAVLKAAAAGDAAARELVERLAERLARICAILGGLLDVERIVFAGAVAASLAPVLRRAAERLGDLTHPPVPELVASTLGGAVVSVGAVTRALELVRTNAMDLAPAPRAAAPSA